MSCELTQAISAEQIPPAHGSVGTGEPPAGIRTESHAHDRPGVSFKHTQASPAAGIPQPHGIVERAGKGQRAIHAESHRMDQTRVTQRTHAFATGAAAVKIAEAKR